MLRVPMLDSLSTFIRTRTPVFAEEFVSLEEAASTYRVDAEEFGDFEVVPGLTLSDISQVQRLVLLIAAQGATELKQHLDDPDLVLNSLTPAFREEALDEILTIALSDPPKVASFKALFGWPASAAEDTFFDVQYRPMLRAGGEWHVPTFVLGRSNLIRAALQNTRRRFYEDDDRVMCAAVADAFKTAGAHAHPNVSFKVDGEVFQVDVLAFVDGALCLLECKSSLLPCSAFELRQTFDHCEKAKDQLNLAVDQVRHDRFRTRVCDRLGIKPDAIRGVLTGIVVDNGMFAGLSLDGHRVVGMAALGNFMVDGNIVVLGQSFALRGPGPVRFDDVRDFLSGSLYQRFFEAMVPWQEPIDMGGRRINHETFVLDLRRLAESFGLAIDDATLLRFADLKGSR